ncbi:MAG: phosphoserine aminotransferase [archaeon ADurb.Bin336]|nr:MAG: phosphoserine aminotransferase [archaeon ADurb.Bin336]
MKLFIPGPVSVSNEIMQSMQREMIGHRGKEFANIFEECSKGLKKVFCTNNRVLISTSSGTGLMEGAIRNCVEKNVLMIECGAFGKKWVQVAKACGKEVDVLQVQKGNAVSKEELEKKLSEKKYEAVCVTHNETSTGVENPLKEIAPLIKEHNALFLVDSVSSMGGAKIEVDEWGIDVCLTSSQKCFSLPPGLSFASVSEGALEKSRTIKDKGYYFDFVELAKEYDSHQTPYTPAVGLIFGLITQLERMLKEGMENVWARHEELAKQTQEWAIKNEMKLFAQSGHRSKTVTCISNEKRINLEEVKKKVKEKGYVMDAGYRKLNEELLASGRADTMRIPHMGNLNSKELQEYLDCLEEAMK